MSGRTLEQDVKLNFLRAKMAALQKKWKKAPSASLWRPDLMNHCYPPPHRERDSHSTYRIENTVIWKQLLQEEAVCILQRTQNNHIREKTSRLDNKTSTQVGDHLSLKWKWKKGGQRKAWVDNGCRIWSDCVILSCRYGPKLWGVFPTPCWISAAKI